MKKTPIISITKVLLPSYIIAKTFHVLPSNRTNFQKVTPRSFWAFYVHLMFTSKRKSTYKMNVSAFVWTSLGLNQGPPDYETNRMIFHDILSWWSVLNISCLRKNDISFHFIEFLWLKLFVYALFTQNRLIDYWSLWQRTTMVMWKVKFWNYFFVSLVKQTKTS